MQRFVCSGGMGMLPSDNGEWYRKQDADAEFARLHDRISDLNSDWELLSSQHDNTSRNCSAFENEMGNLQVENGDIKANLQHMRDGYAAALKERDTLRDVLALLAPDLKAMAILYAQTGDHTRSQALANICKSVGVL